MPSIVTVSVEPGVMFAISLKSTVTVFVPETAGFAVETAFIFNELPTVSSSPTVNRPLELMVVLAEVLPDTVHVMHWDTFVVEPSPVTVAVNWREPPLIMPVALPVEETVTVSASGLTVTVLLPTAALLITEVASTVNEMCIRDSCCTSSY